MAQRLTARPRHFRLLWIVAALVLAGVVLRTAAALAIEYNWWKELGQVQTWISLALYRVVPVAGATLLIFVTLWLTHARAMKFARASLGEWRLYARVATLALLVFSFLLALILTDTWTVVRYFGGRGLETASSYHDPVFGLPVSFYFFDLPFYELLLTLLLTLSAASVLLYWVAARAWQLRSQFAGLGEQSGVIGIDVRALRLEGALEGLFLRSALVIFLLALAARFYLDRFGMLYNEHRFLVGIDYVDETIALPLQWLVIAAALASAVLVSLRRWRPALLLLVVLVVQFLAPRVVAIFVRPSEITIQKPYILRHIQATRNAYGISDHVKEVDFAAQLEARVDPARHKLALENIRLWDWRAFHDTVTQIQALRPYYVFKDSDVDRYSINGQIRQVLVTPREIDIRGLPDAASGWINSRFVYTHGYGLVMAEANRITPDGSPLLLIQDAPPTVKASGLKVTRPQLYFGEVSHEPVFVDTGQQEFDYPSGGQNIHNSYQGKGGFPVASLWMRLAAALDYGDWNILITEYLTGESRMMINRRVLDRLGKLTGFLQWDSDPYLVLTDEGRMVWIADGYTTSAAHPYSRTLDSPKFGTINYIRNAVKATIDAYDGEVHLYVFDPGDPIIQAYRHLFPALFQPVSAMPPDLRRHARYPEEIFLTQAEIYRTFHMRDPEAFYNNEDLWSFAKIKAQAQGAESDTLGATYLMASLPGGETPEFLLTIPFTPRGKDNLIGLMLARCDGEKLGEIVVLQLSKQTLIYGPLQVDALIDQDQNISKDLTLWNQQGSQVLRGKMLVLPIENTFLYVQPIYIQSQSARLPQLKKVVLAMGKRLFYHDTYDEALAELTGGSYQPQPAPAAAAAAAGAAAPAAAAAQPAPGDRRIQEIRTHLERYRELSAQGHWAEAGKELEAIDALAKK